MCGGVYQGGVGDDEAFYLCLQLVDLSLRQSEAGYHLPGGPQGRNITLQMQKLDTDLGRGSVQELTLHNIALTGAFQDTCHILLTVGWGGDGLQKE